jgi:hypothetical protein
MRMVTITFKPFSEMFCPANPTEFIAEMNKVVSGHVNDNGERVRIEFGYPIPPFCPESPAEFIERLNEVSRGYVESTGDPVHVSFGFSGEFCWKDPNAVLSGLANNYAAYVE